MKSTILIAIVMALVFPFPPNADSAELSPREILQIADEARGNLDGVEWLVYVQSIEHGHEQNRKLHVKARGYDFLATMTYPPKVKRHKLLMIDHNMWFAKPGLRKPVPVSSRQKLIGGAAYGDIAATNYSEDYRPVSITDDMVDGEACFLFDLKSSSKKATYDRIRYWIAKERLVGVKAEYFTVSGKILKSARFEYKNQIDQGNTPQPFISKMTIKDALIEDNITTLYFSKPKVVEVPSSTLDLNLLMIR